MQIPKKQCMECKDLPEGEVIKGHNHIIPSISEIHNSIFILAKAIEDGKISGIVDDLLSNLSHNKENKNNG